MFKRSIITILCGLVLGLTTLEAATMHVILVGDTNDGTLGNAMKINVNKMYNEMSIAADKTDLDFHVIMASGATANRNHVLRQINQLEVGEDDVVVAYFSMHGYRNNSKVSQWPNLYFGEDFTGVELEYIVDKVSKKNPRLLIVIADSCNNPVRDNAINTIKKRALAVEAKTPLQEEIERQNYSKLFLETSGVIIVTGAIPGEFAWGINGVGTFLTMSLIDGLNAAVKRKGAASWELIFSQLDQRVNRYMGSNGRQNPQFAIMTN